MPEVIDAQELPTLATLRGRAAQARLDKWHTVHLELETVTPVYGGGTQAGTVDQLLPFRPRAIRNGIRHWWWLLNRRDSKYLGNGGGEKLYRDMMAIWGGVTDGDHGQTAKVRVRVSALPDLVQLKRHLQQYVPRNDDQSKYALWMAMAGNNRDCATLLNPGLRFTLDFDVASDLDEETQTNVGDAINVWAHLGGIGARTSRGLGKSKITNARFPAANEALAVKATVDMENDDWFTFCFKNPQNARTGAFNYCVPSAPGSVRSNAVDAWIVALGLYQEYRQARQLDAYGNRRKQSYLPKADVIRVTVGPEGHTPHPNIRANNLPLFELMHGGPIVYKFKQGPNREPPEGTLLFASTQDGKFDRYTSPLTVTCLRTATNGYIPFAFYETHHWQDIKDKRVLIQSRNGGPAGTIPPGEWWPDIDTPAGQTAAKAILAGSVMHPPNGCDQRRAALIAAAPDDGDPLHAFLNFFQSWRFQD